ncbi:MAG: hypothetical protein AABZ15_11680 [Nitrospirota bacterium]
MENRGQGPGAGVREEIQFTAEDLARLRSSAESAAAIARRHGCRDATYQERRWEFAKDWAAGNRWNTKKSWNWAREIKKELDEMKRKGIEGSRYGTARAAR